jgi:hypothetical protein
MLKLLDRLFGRNPEELESEREATRAERGKLAGKIIELDEMVRLSLILLEGKKK